MRIFLVLLLISACFLACEAQWGYYSPYYGGYGGYTNYYYPSYSYSYYPSYGYNYGGYSGYGGYGGYSNYGYGGYGGWCGIRCRRFQRRLMWAQMMNPYMYGRK